MREVYSVAHAEFRQAEALSATPAESAPAVPSLLESAHAITIRLGERPLRAEIERLAHRAGVQLVRAGT